MWDQEFAGDASNPIRVVLGLYPRSILSPAAFAGRSASGSDRARTSRGALPTRADRKPPSG